ncbi:MAG: glycosyltransferase [Clostridia bacterium]|nr:glycosyltransferase [Clostridia bacterium]
MDSKRIAFINAIPYGSTGKIVKGIAKIAKNEGAETLTYLSWTKGYRKSDDPDVIVGSFLGKLFHMGMAKLNGKNGCYSKRDTKKLLKKLDEFKPDVIDLHILHNWNMNLPMLFDYIKKNKIKTVWTFHDCWAFTGQCPHFIMAGCDKWKTACHSCPQYREYPGAYVDKTELMHRLKKEWFLGIEDLTIVTPSKWLGELVKESFLKDYSVKVINNGIDLDIFKPTESDFRKKYNIEDKKVVLGVAFGWGRRKGLDVFCQLANELPNDYQIVLVGTDEETDKQLPSNIISIHRTSNQKELAEIYSASDVFANPTREDTFPTVNMEALACGTPVVTFKTGGSPEIVDESCGSVVGVDDAFMFKDEIVRVCDSAIYSKDACIERSRQFDMRDKFKQHYDLF